jgi:hypothetical protein
LARSARRFRIVGLIFIATWVLLVAMKSKPYYFAASLPVMMAAGGVAWERWTAAAPRRWGRWVMLATLVVGFGVFAPLGLPLLSPDGLSGYQAGLGISPIVAEVGHDAELPQYFADRFGWFELARAVSEVYAELSAEDRARAVVIGANYGHAGALEYWSSEFELPPIYSVHNSYWFWGPPLVVDDAVIIVTTSDPVRTAQRFESAIDAGRVETRWAEESRITIVVGRGLIQPVDELWAEVKHFI